MVKARKYVVKNHFQGLPKRDDYEIVEYELPPIKNGEILVKIEWVSVDPYMRAYNLRTPVPYDQFGFQIGVVIESKNSSYPVGSRITSHMGWCDYAVLKNTSTMEIVPLPDLEGFPTHIGIGAIGMPGITAYFGLLDICNPKPGETVVVSGAAGAVGSIVGQIAKIKGCKVIGFAGSDAKVEWLEKELGFDKAINYKTADIVKSLEKAAPKGVDCYFDNVGGELSSMIMARMNDFGRVSVCGSISVYNDDPRKMTKSSTVQQTIVFKQLKVEGFLVTRWKQPVNRFPEAVAELLKWVKSGQLKTRSHITEGFDKIFDAFIGMLRGENTGKAVVKI